MKIFKKNLLKNINDSLAYLKNCKKYFHFVIILFFLSFFIGILCPTPDMILNIFKNFLEELINKTMNLNTPDLFWFILLNNLKVALFAIIFGLFLGIPPIILTFSNGYILGLVSKLVISENGVLYLWRIIPHGIFELPAAIISFVIGIKLGFSLLISSKDKNILKILKSSLKVFFLVVFPLLVIAAIIESILIKLV